ncbi:MAG: hypothetical protein OSJ46_03155 [Duncaniella sp.]|nr:hypothetical protein [Duncaniella sp.]
MKLFKHICLTVLCCMAAGAASAQYYEIANRLPGLLSPALSGSLNYKGFVELSGVAGLGDNRANFVGVSTSQGFRYASWFFMGVGMGIDVAMAQRDDGLSDLPPDQQPWYYQRSSSSTKAMLPIFSDFRFNIGPESGTSCYIDLKVGAAWFLGDSYFALRDARMGRGAQFYFKPSIGIRVPVNAQNPRQAFNFGITYQLITSGNNYSRYGNSVTLNSIGASISYEW